MCCLLLCRHNESHLQQSRKSKECHALSETDVCIKCQETEKKLLAKQKQSEENAKLLLKRNDPLHTMSTEKLQVALKCVRQQEKKLWQKLELLKAERFCISQPGAAQGHGNIYESIQAI